MKHMASDEKKSKSKSSSTKRSRVRKEQKTPTFVVCVQSGGYLDLEPLKVYRIKLDANASKHKLLRVIDSSGEDYLYPEDYFRPIQAPQNLFRIVAKFA